MSRLTPTAIVQVALELVRTDGPAAVTARALGARLDADPTAVYRHFASMDDLLRAVGDKLLANVAPRQATVDGANWSEVVETVCVRLRRATLANPALATLIRSGPSLHINETRITELLLAAFAAGGYDDQAIVRAYHSVIELTIGSAAIDAATHALDARTRSSTYQSWRDHYRSLDAQAVPHSVRLANLLYRGSAEDRFVVALRAMLAGLGGGS